MALTNFLFGDKFSLRKPPPRKSKILTQNLDLFNQYIENSIPENQFVINLGSNVLSLEDNDWCYSSNEVKNSKSSSHYKHEMNKQIEINNYFKIKVDILINMLTQLSAEYQLQEKEIRKLKKYPVNPWSLFGRKHIPLTSPPTTKPPITTTKLKYSPPRASPKFDFRDYDENGPEKYLLRNDMLQFQNGLITNKLQSDERGSNLYARDFLERHKHAPTSLEVPGGFTAKLEGEDILLAQKLADLGDNLHHNPSVASSNNDTTLTIEKENGDGLKKSANNQHIMLYRYIMSQSTESSTLVNYFTLRGVVRKNMAMALFGGESRNGTKSLSDNATSVASTMTIAGSSLNNLTVGDKSTQTRLLNTIKTTINSEVNRTSGITVTKLNPINTIGNAASYSSTIQIAQSEPSKFNTINTPGIEVPITKVQTTLGIYVHDQFAAFQRSTDSSFGNKLLPQNTTKGLMSLNLQVGLVRYLDKNFISDFLQFLGSRWPIFGEIKQLDLHTNYDNIPSYEDQNGRSKEIGTLENGVNSDKLRTKISLRRNMNPKDFVNCVLCFTPSRSCETRHACNNKINTVVAQSPDRDTITDDDNRHELSGFKSTVTNIIRNINHLLLAPNNK